MREKITILVEINVSVHYKISSSKTEGEKI